MDFDCHVDVPLRATDIYVTLPRAQERGCGLIHRHAAYLSETLHLTQRDMQ